MQIILTHEESEEYFLSALCNGLNYSLSMWGWQLDYKETDYQECRNKLDSPCLENVYMQMLRDKKPFTFCDAEGDEPSVSLTLELIHERMNHVPVKDISDMVNENDDAGTADTILQTILFDKIIYG